MVCLECARVLRHEGCECKETELTLKQKSAAACRAIARDFIRSTCKTDKEFEARMVSLGCVATSERLLESA